MKLTHLKLVPLALLVLFTACEKDELQAALDATKKQLATTQNELGAAQQENQTLREKISSLEGQISDLQARNTQLEAQIGDLASKAGSTALELAELRAEKAKREVELLLYKDLFAKLKSMIDAGTIDVEIRKGRLVVKMASSILFDSGKSELRPEGEAALVDLATALKSVGKRDFLVAGHTDNVPIKTARFRDNWQLSTARAVTVVNFLVNQAMTPQQLGAAGFGEFDPVADNTTEDGKGKNRRIEVILMPNLGEIPGLRDIVGGKSPAKPPAKPTP